MTIISIRVNVFKIHPDGVFFIVTAIFCLDSGCFPLMQGMCRDAKENHVKQDDYRCIEGVRRCDSHTPIYVYRYDSESVIIGHLLA